MRFRVIRLVLISLLLFGAVSIILFPVFPRVGKTPPEATFLNLHQLSVALRMYCEDYHTFPPMQDVNIAFTHLGPYLWPNGNLNVSPMFDRVGGKPFQPNPTLGGKKCKQIPDTAITFYSEPKDDSGSRAVLTANGFVKRLTKQEWEVRKGEVFGN